MVDERGKKAFNQDNLYARNIFLIYSAIWSSTFFTHNYLLFEST